MLAEMKLVSVDFQGALELLMIERSMLTTLRTWKVGLAWERFPRSAVSPNSPLWNNSTLPSRFKLPKPIAWTKFNIKLVRDVTLELSLYPFDYFVTNHNIPSSYIFQYLQLSNAFRSQFPAGGLR